MALTLNDKPWYWGFGIGLVIAIAAVAAVHYLLVQDMQQRISADEAQIADLDQKIEQGRAAERKLPQFRAEVDRLRGELEKLRRILPSTKNTEEIIQKIKAVVDQGDFTLKKLTFPRLTVAKGGGDPYSEWPIAVSVDGRYHNLAILFNRLGNFSRIMNVENITIAAMPSQLEKTVSSDFVAKTFVYVEPSEEPAKAKVAKPGGEAKKKDESQ
jgi:type IV pilus assembly protein PilO